MFIPSQQKVCDACNGIFFTNNITQKNCDDCSGKKLSHFATEQHHDFITDIFSTNNKWRPFAITCLGLVAIAIIILYII